MKTIEVRGAREHNLRSVSLSLPRDSLIVFTGVSGSGKSSLAFDTLYAEGQRRYIESLSAYARQFMGQLQKPDCDLITGLSPSIAIQQKTTGWNPRSTVGTITAIHDFLRVLYARIGVQHCTQCGRAITAQSREQIIAGIYAAFDNQSRDRPPSRDRKGAGSSQREASGSRSHSPTGGLEATNPLTDVRGSDRRAARQAPRPPKYRKPSRGSASPRLIILAPVARGQKGEFRDLFDDLIRAGYVRARVDGEIVPLSENLSLKKNQRHDIEVVIDRLTLDGDARARLAEAIEGALRMGGGTLIVTEDRDGQSKRPGDKVFSSRYACTHCNLSYQPPSPQLFSFNSPTGMCPQCDGLGEIFDFNPDLLVPDDSLNFFAPCIAPLRVKIGQWRRHIFYGVARAVGFDIDLPWKKLPQNAKDALLYGTGDKHITYEWKWSGGVWKHGGTFDGVLTEIREKYRKAKAGFVREYYEKFMRRGPCTACRGARLNPQAASVRLPMTARGRKTAKAATGPAIHEFCAVTVAEAQASLDRLALTPVQRIVAEEVLKELRARLGFLLEVGLDYLALDRTAPTLSGGELQRIRLAGQIGAGLVGVLYVLDEPSIGLHARDNDRLLASLARLRDAGNTVIVVEHDEATMRAADHVVDFGPGPGVRGGEVVAAGTIDDLLREGKSLTGQYLSGKRTIEVPDKRRPVGTKKSAEARDAQG